MISGVLRSEKEHSATLFLAISYDPALSIVLAFLDLGRSFLSPAFCLSAGQRREDYRRARAQLEKKECWPSHAAPLLSSAIK